MSRGRLARLVFAGGLAAKALAGQSPTCEEPGFVAADRYAVSPFLPRAAVDMTGDGHLDLVGSRSGGSDSALVVLLGTEGGGFGESVVTPVESVDSLVVGDFTGEGTPDVVTLSDSYPSFGLWLYVGNGDGTFQPPVQIAPSPAGNRLLAGDVDGDGKLDVVVSGSAWIEVYLNAGGGTFSGPSRTPAWSGDFVLGDIDGDGVLDVVGVRPAAPPLSSALVYYPGRADGTFDPSHDIAPGDFHSVRVGDLNQDGHLDVVAAQDFAVVAALGNGDGTFGPLLQSFAPPGVATLELGDLDADGFPDVIIGESDYPYTYATGLAVQLGKGDGTFQGGSAYAVPNPQFVVADFDGDGNADVAVETSADLDLYVFRGTGDGGLRGPRLFGLATPIFAIVSGDFNEDGRPDVADIFYYTGTIIGYSFGGPRGEFHGGGTISLNVSMTSLATGDVNGDGHLDLVVLAVANQTDYTMPVLLGDGHGNFAVASNTPVAPFAFQSKLQLADLDGDGHLDAVTLNIDTNARSDQIAILRGHGDGNFGPSSTVSLPSPLSALTIADVTGDGIPDLLAAGAEIGSLTGLLYVVPGRGDGTFDPPVTYQTVAAPTKIVLADFDEDGHTDLAVAGSDAALLIYPGLGGGAFGQPSAIAAGGSLFDLVARDFQGDGHVDLFATSYPRARLLYGDGHGGFSAPMGYLVGGLGVQTLLADDFDGNGTTDVIVADSSFFGGGFVLLQNALLAVKVHDVPPPNPGQPLTLIAEASGFGALSYEWRKNGVPLADGGAISGSHRAVLTISPVSFDDAASYDVVVTDACGSVTSNAISLSVEFADVPPSSPFHDDIISIATAGISTGCGGGNYCPTSPVRRDQMAVFLLKSEHGSNYAPPACSGVFADVPCPSAFADWIEQLAAEGVTGGCGGGNYCPAGSVTRAQMAVFLLKTSQGSSYTPPLATGIFGDVPVGSFGADFIEDLYNRGITGGCQAAPLLYCPGNSVLRQQMATFLVRTFFP